MKPIKELRTFGKAKLLFDLFPDETAKSIDYIKSIAESFQDNPQIINQFQ